LTCQKATSLIASYLAANLSPEVEQAYDTHLEVCPDCVAFLQTYRKTIEITAAFLRSSKYTPHKLTLGLPANSRPSR
jgi:hypothetical protein